MGGTTGHALCYPLSRERGDRPVAARRGRRCQASRRLRGRGSAVGLARGRPRPGVPVFTDVTRLKDHWLRAVPPSASTAGRSCPRGPKRSSFTSLPLLALRRRCALLRCHVRPATRPATHALLCRPRQAHVTSLLFWSRTHRHCAENPPSIGSAIPVMKEAASVARKSTPAAHSSGRARRPRGCASMC